MMRRRAGANNPQNPVIAAAMRATATQLLGRVLLPAQLHRSLMSWLLLLLQAQFLRLHHAMKVAIFWDSLAH